MAGCFVIAAAIAGCAPTGDMQQLQSNEFALRSMVANDRQQIDGLQEQVARLNDRVSELEHNGGGGGGNDKLTALDQRVSKLESQLASAQPGTATPGAPDTAAGGLGAGAAGAAGLPGAPAGAETASAALPGTNPPEASVPAVAAPSWRSSVDEELGKSYDDPGAKLYRSGLIDLKNGKYQQALAKFQDLQRRYPKSNLSEPAEYFSANALYEMGKYDQAILQFNDLTMRFPKGKYASAALLREAQAFMQINDRIDARLTLQKLLNDHPDSPEAASAKSMMQTLAS